MARPIKRGIDYFPMDVTIDDKFEIIESKHGLIAFAIIIKLYQSIYKDGCYIDWNEDKLLILKKRINVDINLINDVINDCFTYKIFDKELYDKYKILTSSGIQKRYLMACERRKSVDLIKKYINVDINSINVHINWVNDHTNTQSKVKESKVNEGGKNDNPTPPILNNPVMNNNNLILSYKDTYHEFISSTGWQEKFCMDHHLEIDFVLNDMKSFLKEMDNSDQFPKKLADTKFHYTKRLEKFLNKNAVADQLSRKSKEKIPMI